MRRVLQACRDEWLAILRDPAARLMLCGATLMYSLLFPMPYMRQLARDIPVVVVDADGSGLSRRAARMVDAAEQIAVIGTVTDMREAAELVRSGSARGVVLIPEQFERLVARGERVVVGVYADASYFMVYSQVASGASQAVGTLSAMIEVRRLQAGGTTEAVARRLRDPLPLATRPLFNPSGGYGNAVVPATIILLLQQTLLVGIGTLAGARRERNTAAAADARSTAGRMLAYALLYTVNAALCYTLVYRSYRLPHHGSLGTALIFLFPFLLAAAALGISISRLFRDRETALPILLGTSLPALFISGFSWPAESLPAWLRALAQLLPTTQAMPAALRVLQMNASLADVRGEWLALWALTLLYFAAAVLLGRRALAHSPARR